MANTAKKYWSVVALALAIAFGIAISEPGPTLVQAAPSPTLVTVTNTPLPTTPANTGSTPLYALDVENSAHHPFGKELSCSIPDGSKICTVSFTVDSGKELVIETASGIGTIPTGGKGFALISATTGGSNLSAVQLPFTFQASYGGTVDTYVGTQSFRLYADPGSTITLEGEEQPVGSATFTFDLSGYTVACGSMGTLTNPCPLP
jgi:hypothetical protein